LACDGHMLRVNCQPFSLRNSSCFCSNAKLPLPRTASCCSGEPSRLIWRRIRSLGQADQASGLPEAVAQNHQLSILMFQQSFKQPAETVIHQRLSAGQGEQTAVQRSVGRWRHAQQLIKRQLAVVSRPALNRQWLQLMLQASVTWNQSFPACGRPWAAAVLCPDRQPAYLLAAAAETVVSHCPAEQRRRPLSRAGDPLCRGNKPGRLSPGKVQC